MNTTVINIPGPLSLSVLTSADAFHAVLAANEIPILGADYAAAKRILPLLEKRLLLEGAGTKKLRRHVALLQRLALEDDRHLPLLWDIGYELKKYSADCHQRAANAVILAGAARFRDLPKIDKTTLSFLKEHRHPVFRTSDPETFLGKAVAETLEEIDASSIEFLREFRDSMAFFYPQHFGKEEAIDSNAPKVLMLRRAIVKEMRREIGDNLFRGGKPEDLSEKFLVKAASFPDVFMDAIRDFLPPYAQLVHVAFLSRHFLEQRHYGTAAYFCSSLKALMHGEISSQDRAMLEFWTTYAQALHRLAVYDEAQKAYRMALKILMSDTKENPLIFRLCASLSDVYRATGKYTEAEHWMMAALDIRRQFFIVEDPHLSLYLYKLAVIQEGLGRLEKARLFYRKSLAMRGEILATAMVFSASLYAKKGEARPVLEMARWADEIRTAFDRAVGRFHFDDATLLPFCAMIVYDEATDMFRIPSAEVKDAGVASKYQA